MGITEQDKSTPKEAPDPALVERITRFNRSIVRVERAPINIVTDHPIKLGEYVSLSAEWTVEPGKTIRGFCGGPPGLRVDVMLQRQPFSGGHQHQGGPVGSVNPPSQVLGPNYPQNQSYIITAPEVCGAIVVTNHYSDGDDRLSILAVRVPGLVAFTGDPHIVLTGSTSTHGQNHYCLPDLQTMLRALANRFFRKFSRKLFVNDMSLVDGGLFDIKGDWNTPHKTHRDGRRVDINSTSMSSDEKDFFKKAAKDVGFPTVILEDDPPHWHLEI